MFTNKFSMLNKYDEEKKVIVHRIHSPEIKQLHYFYKFLKKRIYDLENSYLNEKFSIVEELYRQIISSIDPFDQLLLNFDFSNLNDFIKKLVKVDYNEDTSEIIKDFISLIKEFRNGRVKNELYSDLKKLYMNVDGENKVILDYYWEKRNEEFHQGKLKQYIIGENFYDAVFFLKSPNYYKQTTTILKSRITYYLSYDIFQSKFSEELIIPDNIKENSSIFEGVKILFNGSENNSQDEDTFESIYNNNYAKKWIEDYKILNNNATTNARLFGLLSGDVILFPTNSRLRLLDCENGLVFKEENSKVELGDWIIIRQSSDEEFIKNSARKQLGVIYDSMFEEVTRYKKQLLDVLDEKKSIFSLMKVLEQHDIHVESQVLKNWIFGDTIRPKEYRKILDFLKYDSDEIKKLEKFASKIHGAHSNAGRELGKIYQKFINEIGFDEIDKEMCHSNRIDLDIDRFGIFTIETIAYVSDVLIEVEYSDLYKRLKKRV